MIVVRAYRVFRPYRLKVLVGDKHVLQVRPYRMKFLVREYRVFRHQMPITRFNRLSYRRIACFVR
jgi:hypothetical protein